MTDDPSHPAGLLTDEENLALSDPDNTELQPELRARIRERLAETLRDFSLLYPTLPRADLEAVFSPDDALKAAEVRSATQDGLALLVLGMFLGDDRIRLRLNDAIVNAGLSYGEDIDVSLDLRRTSLPTLEQFAGQAHDEGVTEHTHRLLEHFIAQADTDPDAIESIAAYLGLDLSSEETEQMHNFLAPYPRAPQTSATDLSVTKQSGNDEDSDM
jgi:hypothetical protein